MQLSKAGRLARVVVRWLSRLDSIRFPPGFLHLYDLPGGLPCGWPPGLMLGPIGLD